MTATSPAAFSSLSAKTTNCCPAATTTTAATDATTTKETGTDIRPAYTQQAATTTATGKQWCKNRWCWIKINNVYYSMTTTWQKPLI